MGAEALLFHGVWEVVLNCNVLLWTVGHDDVDICGSSTLLVSWATMSLPMLFATYVGLN